MSQSTMSIQAIRARARDILHAHDLTQEGFARKHGLSYTWLTKFLQGRMVNPRYQTLERLQLALDAESRDSRSVAPSHHLTAA